MLRQKGKLISNIYMKSEDKFPPIKDFHALLGNPSKKMCLQAFLQTAYQSTVATSKHWDHLLYSKQQCKESQYRQASARVHMLPHSWHSHVHLIMLSGERATQRLLFLTLRTLTTTYKLHMLFSRHQGSCVWNGNINWSLPDVCAMRKWPHPSYRCMCSLHVTTTLASIEQARSSLQIASKVPKRCMTC